MRNSFPSRAAVVPVIRPTALNPGILSGRIISDIMKKRLTLSFVNFWFCFRQDVAETSLERGEGQEEREVVHTVL
jgi:hypothetical protein